MPGLPEVGPAAVQFIQNVMDDEMKLQARRVQKDLAAEIVDTMHLQINAEEKKKMVRRVLDALQGRAPEGSEEVKSVMQFFAMKMGRERIERCRGDAVPAPIEPGEDTGAADSQDRARHRNADEHRRHDEPRRHDGAADSSSSTRATMAVVRGVQVDLNRPLATCRVCISHIANSPGYAA